MNVKVIFNPNASRRRAKARLEAARTALTAVGLGYELYVTESQGAAADVARAAAQAGYAAVVAAGGDGTVNEVVNGLLAAAGDGPTVPLGILPLGTGNDFSDMAGLPVDLIAAAQIIAQQRTRQIDGGWVAFRESGSRDVWQERYFLNNCAAAMEPLVTLENDRITNVHGTARYLVALVRALVKLQAWQMHIRWENGALTGPTYLLSMANTPRTGGLFTIAPDALLDDGCLDVIHAPEMPKRQVMMILPRFFDGSHVRHPKIRTLRAADIHVSSRPGTPIHVDGELIAASADEIHCRALPGQVTLLCP